VSFLQHRALQLYPCVCCRSGHASRSTTQIPVASRISGFNYAIRNIVAEARRVEAGGTRVRYLNIGDPIIFGFETPPHLVAAVERALHDGHNGYAPSVGIAPAREAVADECGRRGMPVPPDRVVLTSGTSEGIELALTALAGPGDEVLVPVPTYPLYTAVLAKIGAKAVFYRTDPARGWLPDLDHLKSSTPATRAWLPSIRTTRPGHPPEVGVRCLRRRSHPLLADEVYADPPSTPVAPSGPDAR
jgi:alanine-synthesizing transaminase